jgi:hypothetical protein
VSGVALDSPAFPARPSFLRLLWAVLLGYISAALVLLIPYVALYLVGLMPRPFAHPGPFPVDGAWSFDADLFAATAVVLVASWCIRSTVIDVVHAPVSLGVVVVAIAVTGYAPFLALRPAALSGVIALPATTWIVRRYAIDRTLPFPRPSRRIWAALAVLGFVVFGSYQAYHPLTATGGGGGPGTTIIDLQNSGWADLTIVRVKGGFVGDPPPWVRPPALPYTVGARGQFQVSVPGGKCPSPVEITFSVLGRASTQRFALPPGLCPR